MIEFYWACLIFGIIMALVSLLGGDLISDAIGGALDALPIDALDALHPMTLLSGVTVFGTAGILLQGNGSADGLSGGLLPLAIAVAVSVILHFAYVRPMRRAETSLGYSIQELAGKIGEVNIPIPADGYGEVRVDFGTVPTYQLAGSFDGTPLPEGTSVVVVEVKDGAVYVAAMSADEVLGAAKEPPALAPPSID